MPTFTRKLLWYLKQPTLYPELARLGFNIICRGLSRKDNLAESWCSARAIPTSEALEKITGVRSSESLKSQFPDIFKRGEEVTAACPVKMGGAGDLDLLYHLAEYAQARAVIETGVAYGWSSIALLLSIQKRDGLLISTDLPYAGMDNDPYVGCVVPDEFRDNWKLLRGADRQRLPEAIRMAGGLDLCHYDSDKSYSGRMWTYPRLWDALFSGGLFISDDIGDNMAFADFASSVGTEPIVVRSGKKYVGILIKR